MGTTTLAVWERVVLLGVAGAAGTLARAGVYAIAAHPKLAQMPLGTLGVNVAGSLLFGMIWPLGESGRLSADARAVILTGFMGAFTTFSTFAFDTGQYLQRGEYVQAGVNVLANNVLGVGAFVLGWWVVRG